jgi:hypothetical protein
VQSDKSKHDALPNDRGAHAGGYTAGVKTRDLLDATVTFSSHPLRSGSDLGTPTRFYVVRERQGQTKVRCENKMRTVLQPRAQRSSHAGNDGADLPLWMTHTQRERERERERESQRQRQRARARQRESERARERDGESCSLAGVMLLFVSLCIISPPEDASEGPVITGS